MAFDIVSFIMGQQSASGGATSYWTRDNYLNGSTSRNFILVSTSGAVGSPSNCQNSNALVPCFCI